MSERRLPLPIVSSHTAGTLYTKTDLATGDNYFGEDNCECLCRSCEASRRNGWANDTETEAIPKPSIENLTSDSAYSLRRRRNLSTNSSRTQSETPDVNLRPHVPKRTPRSLTRFKDAESALNKSPSAELSLTPTKTKRNRELEPVTTADSHPTKKMKLENPVKVEEDSVIAGQLLSLDALAEANEESNQGAPSPPSSFARSSSMNSMSSPSDGATSTDATSVDDETIIVEIKEGEKDAQTRLLHVSTTDTSGILRTAVAATSSVQLQNGSTSPAELHSLQDLDSSSMTVASKQRTKRKRKLPQPTADLDHAPAVRVPGDYVLTPALLGEPQSAWINCRHCEEPFVQKDAYYTRASCPRCERHSKLYGYMWPKTDKEGNWDTEKRVLDHRTVHRFIRPSEEKVVRRRGRSSTESRPLTSEVGEVAPKSDKTSKRRGGRRKATQE